MDKNRIRSLRDRVLGGHDRVACLEELRKAIEIKSSLQWRAETATHCVGYALPQQLAWEVKALEEALGTLEEGKEQEAASRLDDLIKLLDN